MLWDRGTYEAEDGDGADALRDGYAKGDLKIVLHGERLRGCWVLVRMRAARAQAAVAADQAPRRVRRPTCDVTAERDDVGDDGPHDGRDRRGQAGLALQPLRRLWDGAVGPTAGSFSPRGVIRPMTNSLRLTFAAVAFAATGRLLTSSRAARAERRSQAGPRARWRGATCSLAGSASPRVDVVSATERSDGAVAAPKAPTKSRTAERDTRYECGRAQSAPGTPAAAQPAPQAQQTVPAESPTATPAPNPRPRSAARRRLCPRTQREPPGGWKTPGQVIRNAPFPINP